MGHFDVAQFLLDARASVDTAAWTMAHETALPAQSEGCPIG